MPDRFSPGAAASASPPAAPPKVSVFWTWVALLFALVGTAGTVWLSLGLVLDVGMDLIPCPLCYLQRTLLMAITAILLVGVFAGPKRSGYLSLITLPLTVAGIGIAGMHVYLEYNGNPPLDCPDGAIVNLYEKYRGHDEMYDMMHEVVTPPKESLAIFVLLFLVQSIDLLRSGSRGGYGFGSLLAAIIIGAALAAGLWFTKSSAEIPKWPQPLKGCRPAPPQGQ
jgi:hypothetical protein